MVDHVADLGKLIANLHSLEFGLRGFLIHFDHNDQNIDFDNLAVGQVIPENSFTNWDTLRVLISKYNTKVETMSADLKIDSEIATLRDVLAHGRVFSNQKAFPLYLFKFTQPAGGKVKVEVAHTMTKEWFEEKRAQVYEAVLKVMKACEQLNP